MTDEIDLAPETKCAQALHATDPQSGGVTPPIYPATTFVRDESYELIAKAHSYGRDENPGYRVAERLLADLEDAPSALLFSSGMAAAMAVVQCLKPGDHIVAPKVMYWGLRNLLIEFCGRWRMGLALFDPAVPGDLENAVRPRETRLVWIETPCNPTWDIIDIAAAGEVAHGIGARLVVDSTVPTPVLTRPVSHGADLVVHSATKYLNGHGDVVAGAVVTAVEDQFWEQVRKVRAEAGAIAGAFEAWLLQRGMRTLFLRVARASDSALKIAQHFEGHENIRAVLYPGLPSHPGHQIARRQMHGGFGGMLSLRIRGGAEGALTVAKKCGVFTRATSLGGVESLIEHRYTIEGKRSPIPKDLLRLSVGIESVDDLIGDLEQALVD
jgi:cystathionine gamma-synthase